MKHQLFLILLASQVLGFLVFSAYWFVFSEVNGVPVPIEPQYNIRMIEMIGSLFTLVAFSGVLLGYFSKKIFSTEKKW